MCRVTSIICLPAIVAFLIVVLASPGSVARANDALQQNSSPHATPELADQQATITNHLNRYCIDCHGSDAREAEVRLDDLDFDALDTGSGVLIEKVLEVVRDRKMPPDDAESPTDRGRAQFVAGLEYQLDELAKVARLSGSRSPPRRLTVEEYNFTMQSLFGVDSEFGDLLPPDPISKSGYRNDRERLGLSSLQMEAYLHSARRAVDRYVKFNATEQEPIRYHIEFEDLYYSTADRYGTRKRAPKPLDHQTFLDRRSDNQSSSAVYADPLSPMMPGAFTENEALRAAIPKLHQQFVAIPNRLPIGEMIVRVRAAGSADRDGRFPRLRVEAGITLGDGCSIDKRLVGEIEVSAPRDQPQTYEFRIRLEDVPTKGPQRDEDTFDRLSVYDMDQIYLSNVSSDNQAIFARGRGAFSDPASDADRISGQLKRMEEDGVNFLALDCIEIEMFPGLSDHHPSYRWQFPTAKPDATDDNELAIAKTSLAEFMPQAYRRPVTADELEKKLELFRAMRSQGDSYQKSLREVIAAVLVSPASLFLELDSSASAKQEDRSLTQHQLASRLSYFLWLSPPDAQLIQHADDGSIMDPSVLRAEAQRLLSDPRSRRFLESFCHQWLRLDKHRIITVDRETYPKYDDELATLAVRETVEYFIEVFSSDSTALDLVDSDYAMLNDRLAQHYHLDPLNEGRLQKIPLPDGSVRGGILTQASIMTLNSDGVDSHPIRRGVWLLDRILNSPPPSPPPNVPEINRRDPDLRGLSLREQIEVHRQQGTCNNCHMKIDPWGFPFENFDATGRWRDERQPGTNENAGAQTAGAQTIDASAVLADGQRFHNIVDLKRYIRKHRSEQFAKSLVHHVLTYALGRAPDYADRQNLDRIQEQFRSSDYRMRELVLAIIDNELFRER